MYSVDQLDKVFELTRIPRPSSGASCPMILCGEHFLHLAYILPGTPKSWDGRTPVMVGEHTPDMACALVRFEDVYAHMFGPPNDEAFNGHPLYVRGLQPYAVFEVNNSSWIRGRERMNSVHPHHSPDLFADYRHFIFAFQDTMFECIAERLEVSVHQGSVAGVLRDSWPKN
jgi:hypothetical protein